MEELQRHTTSVANLDSQFAQQREADAKRNRPQALEGMTQLRDELLGESSPTAIAAAAAVPIRPAATDAIARHGREESEVRADMADYARLTGHLPNAQLDATANPRAHYQRSILGERDVLDVGMSPERSTIFHELGHGSEFENPEIGDAARSFVAARALLATDGAPPQPQALREMVPGSNYKPEEMALEGGFANKYTGKTYPDGATEVISTGIEKFTDPELMLRLFESDPEHFELILGAVRAMRAKP